MAEKEKLIELKDLQITFGSGKKKFVAVDHVNFDIYKGETFSLVGESGISRRDSFQRTTYQRKDFQRAGLRSNQEMSDDFPGSAGIFE